MWINSHRNLTESNIFSTSQMSKVRLGNSNWPNVIMVRVQTQVWLTAQIYHIHHWPIPLIITLQVQHNSYAQDFFFLLFHLLQLRKKGCGYGTEMQGTWGKGNIPNSVHLEFKKETLCIMEELLPSRCYLSIYLSISPYISLSFLFLVSLPFLYNHIKNWKIKIIFTVSIWSV